MMSVYKLPIVIHALRLSERGRLDLSERVILTPQDRRPGASAMAETIAARGPLTVTIRDIITAIVVTSDNTASDWLLRRIGGPTAVAETLRSLNLDGVDVSRYELEFAADYHGLCCVADMRPFSLEKFAAAVEAAARRGPRARREGVRKRSARYRDAGRLHDAAVAAAPAGVAERGVHGVAARPDAADARARRPDPGRAAGRDAGRPPAGHVRLTAGVRAAHNDTGIMTLPGGARASRDRRLSQGRRRDRRGARRGDRPVRPRRLRVGTRHGTIDSNFFHPRGS